MYAYLEGTFPAWSVWVLQSFQIYQRTVTASFSKEAVIWNYSERFFRMIKKKNNNHPHYRHCLYISNFCYFQIHKPLRSFSFTPISSLFKLLLYSHRWRVYVHKVHMRQCLTLKNRHYLINKKKVETSLRALRIPVFSMLVMVLDWKNNSVETPGDTNNRLSKDFDY